MEYADFLAQQQQQNDQDAVQSLLSAPNDSSDVGSWNLQDIQRTPRTPDDPQEGGYSPSAVNIALPSANESDHDGDQYWEGPPAQEGSSESFGFQSQSANPQASAQWEQSNPSPMTVTFQETSTSTPVSAGTPVPSITEPPAPSHPVREPPQPQSPLEAARARVQRSPYDHDAWQHYIVQAEQMADLQKIRDAYEELLQAFPNTSSAQIAYLAHFLTPPLFQQAEALFARFLRPSPSVDLWKFYLTYVRRVNTNISDPTTRDVVKKAYEFALSHIGQDKDSGEIWKDYIEFLKSGETRTTWDTQQKMDALRSVYHRAVVIPLENVEVLWRELDQYENGLNKITAKKFLADLSPAHMTAKAALRDLKKHVLPIATPVVNVGSSAALNLPPYPTWTTDTDRTLAQAWKTYIKWEEGNPLDIEDQTTLQGRIAFAHRKAVARMRFFPEISYNAFNYFTSIGKHEEASSLLKQSMDANRSSFLLHFAYAELQETQKNYAEVHAILDGLINTLHKQTEDLEEQIKQEVEAARASALNGTAEESSGPAIVEAEDRARKVTEMRAKDVETAKNELSLVWIMLMRFSRRAEGLKPARNVFSRARKDKYCAWCVYEAAALMEYHCTKAADVATKIFEIGLKSFGEDVEFVIRYLGFLISVNDENNARALFERVAPTFPPEKARPLWERWTRYEYNFGDFAASQKLDKRISELYPNDPPIKRFAQRYTYLGVDAIAARDLGFGVKPSIFSPPSQKAELGQASPNGASGAQLSVNAGTNKRAASPAGRRREPSPPPAKRLKPSSPPPREREREGRRHSPRRDHRRERDARDAVPEGVAWFLGTLPSAAVFDGPKFKAEDILQMFRSADIVPSRPERSRSPPPPRGGRPPPDYGPYQGPGGRGRRY